MKSTFDMTTRGYLRAVALLYLRFDLFLISFVRDFHRTRGDHAPSAALSAERHERNNGYGVWGTRAFRTRRRTPRMRIKTYKQPSIRRDLSNTCRERVRREIRTGRRTCSRVSLDRCDKISFPQDDYVRQEGYPVERHTVITSDGYNLTLHRIPYSRNEDPSAVTRKPVVLVQHGILCSSTDWVIAGQNNSLGECVTSRGLTTRSAGERAPGRLYTIRPFGGAPADPLLLLSRYSPAWVRVLYDLYDCLFSEASARLQQGILSIHSRRLFYETILCTFHCECVKMSKNHTLRQNFTVSFYTHSLVP